MVLIYEEYFVGSVSMKQISWNNVLDIMEVVARDKSKDILQHSQCCYELVQMFTKYFGYNSFPKFAKRIDITLTEFYMGIAERRNMRFLCVTKADKAKVLDELCNRVIFVY